MGFSTEDISLGKAAAGGDSATPEAITRACRAVVELKSMGFAPNRILGALKLHNNDVAGATEACLAAASGPS